MGPLQLTPDEPHGLVSNRRRTTRRGPIGEPFKLELKVGYKHFTAAKVEGAAGHYAVTSRATHAVGAARVWTIALRGSSPRNTSREG
jgi:hypothetical protein